MKHDMDNFKEIADKIERESRERRWIITLLILVGVMIGMSVLISHPEYRTEIKDFYNKINNLPLVNAQIEKPITTYGSNYRKLDYADGSSAVGIHLNPYYYADDKGTEWFNLRSLKGYGNYKCVIIKDEVKAVCDDFNYTSISLSGLQSISLTASSYPIYITNGKTNVSLGSISFKNNQDIKSLSIPYIWGEEIHIGTSSTVIKLTGGDITQDGSVWFNNGLFVYGRTTNLQSQPVGIQPSGEQDRVYVQFSTTSIPSGSTINMVYLNLSFTASSGTGACELRQIEKSPTSQPDTSAGNTQLYLDAANGTQYNASLNCFTNGWRNINLTGAPSQLQNQLTAGWFAVAVKKLVESSYESVSMSESTSDPELWVTYTAPPDTTPPLISFVTPTPANGLSTSDTNHTLNISITETNLGIMKFNWNGTNYTFYNDTLVYMNFENLSVLGESQIKVKDLSTNSNDGTVNGVATWISNGRYGGAEKFNGATGNNVQITSNSILNSPNVTQQLTIAAWINIASNIGNDYPTIVRKIPNTMVSPYLVYNLMLSGTSGNAKVFSFAIANTSTSAGVGSTGNVPLNTWYYVVGTYNGSLFSLYVNGILNNTAQKPNGQWITTSTGDLYIGDSGFSNVFNGTIDEVRIYNRSLSADEVNMSYYSNLYKYSLSGWALIINKSQLSVSNYTYFAYAKDLSGYDNMTSIRSLNIISPDTCTYLSGNWNINCWDNCSIRTNVNVAGNLSLIGAGNFNVFGNISFISTNQYKFQYSGCQVNLFSGGSFV